MAQTAYINPGITNPAVTTSPNPFMQGMWINQDRNMAQDAMEQELLLRKIEAARALQDLSEYRAGQAGRLADIEAARSKSVGAANRAPIEEAAKMRDLEFQNSPQMVQLNQETQMIQALGKLTTEQQRQALQQSQFSAQLFKPIIDLAESGGSPQDIAASINLAFRKMEDAGMDTSQLRSMGLRQLLPQFKATYNLATNSIPLLEKLIEQQGKTSGELAVGAQQGEYSLERQRLANQGAANVQRIKEAGDTNTTKRLEQQAATTLARLGKGENVSDTDKRSTRAFLESKWRKDNSESLMNMLFLMPAETRPTDVDSWINQRMMHELSGLYPELYSAPSGSSSKYKIGDSVSKGGVTYEIVGFDKDGEPLVKRK